MIPASSPDEALAMAYEIMGKDISSRKPVTVLDSVIIRILLKHFLKPSEVYRYCLRYIVGST